MKSCVNVIIIMVTHATTYQTRNNASPLRWFGHTGRMENEEFVKKVYLSSVEGHNRRGRPLRRWEDRVKEYMSEKGVRGNGLEWARRECMDRERWMSVGHDHSLWGRFWRERSVGAID